MAFIQTVRLSLTLVTAIGSALTAGIFFAFSTFVMQTLGQQTHSSGIVTMQAINITVINPWFIPTRSSSTTDQLSPRIPPSSLKGGR